MRIVHSRKVRPVESSAKVVSLLKTIAEGQLRGWVERISVPRHFGAEPAQNRAPADWLVNVFDSMGFRVERQGEFSNIVALPEMAFEKAVLVGAHYDSVPMPHGHTRHIGLRLPAASHPASHGLRDPAGGTGSCKCGDLSR
jgi:acetylornithine deacetylase/succinyl-diaminopimelate desuccinylase-like protein